jgi:hypothetical protein
MATRDPIKLLLLRITCTFKYAAPMNGGQYNDVLANDTYLVAVVKRLFYMIFGWWSFWLICIKPIESYIFHIKTFLIISSIVLKTGLMTKLVRLLVHRSNQWFIGSMSEPVMKKYSLF